MNHNSPFFFSFIGGALARRISSDTAQSWFTVERGKRFRHEPWVLGGKGFNAKALSTRRTVLVNHGMQAEVRELRGQSLPGEAAKSGVWADGHRRHPQGHCQLTRRRATRV